MSQFVIYGIQRTGTTLIGTSLNNHPDILCLGELFDPNENYRPKEMLPYILFIKNSNNLNSNQTNLINNKETIFNYLDIYYSKSFKCIGFKLMLNQTKRLPFVLDYLKSRSLRIIKVVRENVLYTYVSRLRAQNTSVFHSTQLKSEEEFMNLSKTKIYIPTDSLIENLDSISKENQELDESVQSLGVNYITVSYNQLMENNPSKFDKILSFLEVKKKNELFSNLKKVSPSELENSIENYNEVKQILEKSKYSSFLDC